MAIKKKLLEDVFKSFLFLLENHHKEYHVLIMTTYTNYFKYFLKSCQNNFSKINSVLNKNITIKTIISLITATALDLKNISHFQNTKHFSHIICEKNGIKIKNKKTYDDIPY
jgi:hypothetical protein